MPTNLSKRLVIGITSRALFNREEANRIYYDQGLKAYTAYLQVLEANLLERRSCFDLIKTFLDILWKAWPKWKENAEKKQFQYHTTQASCIPINEREENAFDLSINRYKEIIHKEEEYDPPKVILGHLKELEAKIATDLTELEAMLR